MAYCVPGVPGGGTPLTVVSRGLLERLSPEELRAVLLHERAHLAQHHGLLRLAFASWARACAWLPSAETARAGVVLVTEMLADDAARRTAPAPVLARALALTVRPAEAPGASASGPDAEPDAESGGLGRRVARLLDPPAPVPGAVAGAAAAACLALPLAVLAVILGPA
nr:M56 family metallopeptidase [Micrococcus sp. ACRRV]